MFEVESASAAVQSSIWASINSWFTPTVLFLLLNLTIATIAFTSSLANHHHPHNHNNNNNKLARSPSVLHRLKSINFKQQPRQPDADYNNNNDDNPNPILEHVEVLQSQYLFQENQAHYTFEQTHQSIHKETQAHFFSGKNGSSADDFEQTYYIIDQNHQNVPQETQTNFISDQNDSNPDDFEQIHQNIYKKTQTHVISDQNGSNVFQQTHENIPYQTQTHFVSDQGVPKTDYFAQAHEEKIEQSSTHDEGAHTQLSGAHFFRSKSDTEPASGEIPAKLPAKMRKSAFGHFEEEEDIAVETRRPATVRERGSARVTQGDEEVDAKADDFINRFKQQLKLQRLDSIIRYTDMINGRGR